MVFTIKNGGMAESFPPNLENGTKQTKVTKP